jgi:phosphopantothenoylcysteine decarboxylase/phosphopantothenate--cysteine ligase
MNSLAHRHICVIVSGGIAAYKGPELVRRLRDAGAEVRVVMTAAATEFVRPLTFQAVSGSPCTSTCSTPPPRRQWGTSNSRAGPTS